MTTSGIFAAIGRFSVRWRWPILAAWVVGTVLAVASLPSLSSVAKDDQTSFLPPSSPSLAAAALASPFQRQDLAPVVIVVTQAGHALTAADQAAVAQVVAGARALPNVVNARELGVSPDGHAVEALVQGNVLGFSNTKASALIHGLRQVIATTATPPGFAAHLAGALAVGVDSQRASAGQGSRTQGYSIIFILVLLAFVFRSFLAPVVTLVPAVVAFTLAGPLIALTSRVGVQVSTFTQLLLIVLVLGAGTDYGLFLVFRVREELRGGLAPKEAVTLALTRVGESITFSAATVIAALMSLLLASFGIYQSLGVPLAIGIFVMLIAGLTLLPALLSIFGRAVFWPSNVRPSLRRAGAWGRVAARIVSRPGLTLAVGLVVFGGLALASLGNRPSGFGGATSPPPGSDSAIGQAALTAHFPQASANPTSLVFRFPEPVWDAPSGLATLQADLGRAPTLRSVLGPLDPNGTPLSPGQLGALHARLGPPAALSPIPPAEVGVAGPVYEAYRATALFVAPDGRTVQFQAKLAAGDPTTTAALEAVPAIRATVARAAHQAGALSSGVAGEAPGGYDVSTASNRDLLRIVPVAVAIIAVLLALVMRSLVAPLYLIASVVLSYLAALGLAVVIFIDLGGQSGLTFILPFLMFIFLLALGEDYNILVMTRIREEAASLPLGLAIGNALSATGSTVTSAGLVLAGTFGVLVLAAGSGPGASQIQAIGAGLGLGILMDSFLVRTLLVPSVVALLGQWNWWPSALSHGSHRPGPGPHQRRPEAAPVP